MAAEEVNVLKKKVSLKERNWSDKEIEQLITSYEARKCLWDISCVNYMNRDAKELAYKEVEEELIVYGITRDEFKLKWKGVRGQFMREVGHCCNCHNSCFTHACNSDCVTGKDTRNISLDCCLFV